MKTVYRVEHVLSRKGPYTGMNYFDEYKWKKEMHCSATGRSGPIDDSVIGMGLEEFSEKWGRENVLFGFSSIEQLKNWFTNEELAALADMDYKIQTYKTKYIKASKFQVVFVCPKEIEYD